MNSRDLASGFIWLFFSIIVFVESFRLGIGTFTNPDMGFIGFWSAALLGILSLIFLVHVLLKKKKEEVEASLHFKGRLWKRTLVILIALLLYSKFMTVLGYLLSTFILMSFLFLIMREGKKWLGSFIYAFAITLFTFLVFSVWLNGQYPQGLFGF